MFLSLRLLMPLGAKLHSSYILHVIRIFGSVFFWFAFLFLRSCQVAQSYLLLTDSPLCCGSSPLLLCRHMLNVTWERKDLSFNNQGFLSNPSMIIVALDRERLWDKVLQEVTESRL